MNSIKNINEEMVHIHDLEQLTYVYADIASLRMKQTQDTVLNQRTFLEGLRSVFEDVRFSYYQYLKSKSKTKKGQNITFLSHNGRSVALLLSANAGLYGQIIPETFRLFMDTVQKQKLEVAIVGRQGLLFFLDEQPNHPYTYFDLPDYGSIQSYLKPIIDHIVQYDSIHLFYGKYKTVITQEAEEVVISSSTSFDEAYESKRNYYYFEPSIEEVLIFFETEFFTSIVEQAINESRLAKYASRITSLDQAGQNIKKRIKILGIQKLNQMHRRYNKKQLNLMPALAFSHG